MNKRIESLLKNQANYLQVECPYKTCPFKCPFCCSAFEGAYPFQEKSLYLEDKQLYFEKLKDVVDRHNVKEIIITGMTDPSLFPEYIQDMADFCKLHDIQSVLQTMDHTREYSDYDVVAYSIRDEAQMSKLPVSGAKTTRYTVVLSDEIGDRELVRFIRDTKLKTMDKGTKWQMTIKYLALTSNNHKTVDKYIETHRRTLSHYMIQAMRNQGVWVDTDCMNIDDMKPTLIFRQGGQLFSHWGSKNPLE